VAWDVLGRIVRDLLARKAGGHLVEASLHEIELRVALTLRGPGADPRSFAERLVEAIDQVLDDAVQHAAAFRPGHAFCHRCSTAACEHSEPPSCRHVFVGYGPTGTPRWEDFAQVCLDRRHPEVDRLYDDPPAFLTLIQNADELRGGLLDAFEAAGYRLLGQLTAGFVPVRARAEEGRGVIALTFQVAASRGTSGRLRHGLNILGRAPGGDDLWSLWDRQGVLPWRGAVSWAQSALATVERRAAGERERRVDGILRGLARRLERDLRARGRRTDHAQRRHDSGERPTRMALPDAREARQDEVLVDERNGTLVILGERGRAHFFTPQGRLVTSVRYSREAIERKRKIGVWRDATSAEAEALRSALAGASPGDPPPKV
jgi:hypothetical protein